MYDVPGLSETLDRIVDRERSIDVLVNNAHELRPGTGFNVPEGSLEAATLETWMRNLIGGIYWAALTTQKLGARMKQQLAGSIINISTMYAWLPRDRNSIKARNSLIHPNTPAAKAGLLSFTRFYSICSNRFGGRMAFGQMQFFPVRFQTPKTAADPMLFSRTAHSWSVLRDLRVWEESAGRTNWRGHFCFWPPMRRALLPDRRKGDCHRWRLDSRLRYNRRGFRCCVCRVLPFFYGLF